MVHALSLLALANVPFWWLIASNGWPANHETLRVFRRLAIFAGQWKAGNLIPVWSSSAFGGHGSPSPIIYNKLFNVISAGLWEVLDAPRAAICGAFVLLTFVAMLGMAAATRAMLGRRDLAIETTSGILTVFSTYATTDWLTRGAAAEYAAFTLVPWLYVWCLTLVVQRRFGAWIGPLMAVLCLAHASIGLYCALLVASACAFGWRPFRQTEAASCGWRAVWRGFVAPVLAAMSFLCVMVPFGLAAAPYPGEVSFQLLAGITPSATHVAFMRLLWEPRWIWGAFTGFFTVQIDPLLLASGLLATVLAVCQRRHRRALGFLLGVAALVLVLQTRQALVFYRVVPGASWLQFSFRLLVFLVPALALCGAAVMDRLRPALGRSGLWAMAAASIVAMSLGKPWFGHAPAPVFSEAEITSAWSDETNAQEPWEYYPLALDLRMTMPAMLAALEPSAATPCLGRPLEDMTKEHARARFAVTCPNGGMATLPIDMAPGMRFTVDGAPATATRRCPDVHPHVAVDGSAIVTVHYPTFGSAIGAALTRSYPSCRQVRS